MFGRSAAPAEQAKATHKMAQSGTAAGQYELLLGSVWFAPIGRDSSRNSLLAVQKTRFISLVALFVALGSLSTFLGFVFASFVN